MSFSPPYGYGVINRYNGMRTPSTIHTKNNLLFEYFARQLYQRAASVYKFTLPDSWPVNYFSAVLLGLGYLAIVKTNKFGVIPQECTLSGFNVFYNPSKAIIANPLIEKTLDPVIDRDCIVIQCNGDYLGIMDTVNYYADLMAIASETATLNMFNSRLSYVYFAEGKAGAEAFKKLYDQLSSGNPIAVAGSQLYDSNGEPRWEMFQQNVGQNYIADKLIDSLKQLDAMFCSDIGIPNANTMKNQRMVVDEVNANNVESQSIAALRMEYIKDGMEKANRMFGLDLNIEWRYPKAQDPESMPKRATTAEQEGSNYG